MSIVHMSQLSQEDLACLGNNLRPPRRAPMHRTRPDRQLQAVNRSLATLGERVTKLEGLTASADYRSRRLSA